jgi:thiosulfate dehydrogenase (quinone) large subunit
LLPLRIFIGLGWIRASLEKVAQPDWFNGVALSEFLSAQVSEGQVVFPFYQALIENVLLSSAGPLGWVVVIGQFLTGLAVLTGTLTNAALLGGLFMNLNFILAGRPNPSAFYMVIETVLFIANTGGVLGVDTWLSRKIPFALLVAQPHFLRKYLPVEKISFLVLGLASVTIAVIALSYVRDFSPNSVDDPAMIIVVLSSMGALSALITFYRLTGAPTEEGT